MRQINPNGFQCLMLLYGRYLILFQKNIFDFDFEQHNIKYTSVKTYFMFIWSGILTAPCYEDMKKNIVTVWHNPKHQNIKSCGPNTCQNVSKLNGWLLSISNTHSDFNSLRPRQNRRHVADDVLKCNFLNETVWITLSNWAVICV